MSASQTDRPEARIDRMLGGMRQWGASDLFVCEGRPPAVRRDGRVVPLDAPPTSPAEMARFLRETLPAAALQSFEESGDLDFGFGHPNGERFRLNLARQQGLVSLVARSLASGALTFAELGLPAGVAALAEQPRGLVLVTGATGSGKSTTLAAMVHALNSTRRAHIVTIEEPIEFVHRDIKSRITQREVGVDTRSFETALRQVVRESPDVIMIGELRDATSVQVALQAALTGHLVLASLHTSDAVQTLRRLAAYVGDAQRSQLALDLSMCLRGVVSQRLLPRKGVRGRVAAVELLTLTPPAARLVRQLQLEALQELMKSCRDGSMITFDRHLLQLHGSGAIAYETGLAHASNPEEFTLGARGMSSGTAAFAGAPEGPASTSLELQALLRYAHTHEASDLHLSVGRPPLVRVRGDLIALEMDPLSAADVRLLLYSILTVPQRSTYELDRELDFALALEDGQRFRVNAFFERGHMAAALRAIPSAVPDPTELGLPEVLLRLADEPHGLLLVVGPTGAGKTTTLACMVDRINAKRPVHIITIEDPIEYSHRSKVATIHQREVGGDTQSFAAALKYILRQDPDVILIGELRDLETVSAALTAAETGHLVMATLHTNDAVQTVDRMVDVFPAHQQEQARSQLAASLLGVVSQRLLPRSDASGRVAAFEIMLANNAIRALIRDNKMHQALSTMQSSRGAGMVTLDQYLAQLVAEGSVDPTVAQRMMRTPAGLPERPEAPRSPPPGRPRR